MILVSVHKENINNKLIPDLKVGIGSSKDYLFFFLAVHNVMTAYVIRLKFLERCFTFEELGNVFQSF
jgi:hypothetical protein